MIDQCLDEHLRERFGIWGGTSEKEHRAICQTTPQPREHGMSPGAYKDNVLSWASDVDPATIEQAARAARLPFIEWHVALMPDAHIGKGATIGSVIPTRGAIIPSAVGVDIGCGMVAAETSLTANDLPHTLDGLHNRIAKRVPAGVGKGHDQPEWDANAKSYKAQPELWRSMSELPEGTHAHRQFGTLGSGNHFVEICLDERDHVWVVLHSGSRGFGNKVAQRHIETAKGLMRRYFIDLDDPDLAYLVEGTPEFDRYVHDMQLAQDYAYWSRDRMVEVVLTELFAQVGAGTEIQRINCHHNFAALENHRGLNVWVTRKGAIRAREGDLGVIPGSMGAASYIVAGKGVAASYTSCSHGAGRRMSRSQAKKRLSVDSLRDAMSGMAWNAGKAEALLDEHPASYKDIDQVMADQEDLVTVLHKLHQVLNYKGV